MKTLRLLLTTQLITLLLLCGSAVQAAKPIEVNLAAAASLKECLNIIIDLYKKAEPDVKVVTNYEASGKLAEQISQGAPVDLFISASQDKMDIVEKKKLLIPNTRKDLVTNKVVLIVPMGKEELFHCFNCLGSEKLNEKGLAIGRSEGCTGRKVCYGDFRFT